MQKTISGKIVDVVNRRIFEGLLTIENGRIQSISPCETSEDHFILPGFTDSHIHIESSMLVPYEFARLALTHGTVATVSDPHEIANVLGIAGVKYMLDNAASARLKFHFGAPSCVPATNFESSGAVIGPEEVEELISRDDIYYLSEMMNYPGVLYKDRDVIRKIEIATKYNKPVDGHAPGLRGKDAKTYISAGISTDHECFKLDEALEKISLGMKILIREGSAAKNFEELHPLLALHPASCMFCSDDKHPDELIEGHINKIVARAVQLGYPLFDVLHAACIHPVYHYKLRNGVLRVGDPADFIVTKDLTHFEILKTYIDGECVAENGQCILPAVEHGCINFFSTIPGEPGDYALPAEKGHIRIIEARDGQLITGEIHELPLIKDGIAIADTARDILKIAVVNRYRKEKPAVAFIKNFGLKRGAIASTVAHDSHNIIAVGTNDDELSRAVNLLIEQSGGLSAVDNHGDMTVALPVAGLMSNLDGVTIGKAYAEIDKKAKAMGSELNAPFMTLSFMALLVIPQLKLSDKGLFDGSAFSFTDTFADPGSCIQK